jgi:hypothetical protein
MLLFSCHSPQPLKGRTSELTSNFEVFLDDFLKLLAVYSPLGVGGCGSKRTNFVPCEGVFTPHLALSSTLLIFPFFRELKKRKKITNLFLIQIQLIDNFLVDGFMEKE